MANNCFARANKRFVVSICGGSGSGKSSLGKCVCDNLGPGLAAKIPTDFYLKSNRFTSLEEFFKHPLEYDWELIDAALQEKDGAILTTPDYDFISFQRTTLQGNRTWQLRPIIIIDAMIPYPGANLTVFLDVPDLQRRERIIQRDKVWKKEVIRYWEQHQITLNYVKSLDKAFDLILDGMLPVEQNAKTVISSVTRVFGMADTLDLSL